MNSIQKMIQKLYSVAPDFLLELCQETENLPVFCEAVEKCLVDEVDANPLRFTLVHFFQEARGSDPEFIKKMLDLALLEVETEMKARESAKARRNRIRAICEVAEQLSDETLETMQTEAEEILADLKASDDADAA